APAPAAAPAPAPAPAAAAAAPGSLPTRSAFWNTWVEDGSNKTVTSLIKGDPAPYRIHLDISAYDFVKLATQARVAGATPVDAGLNDILARHQANDFYLRIRPVAITKNATIQMANSDPFAEMRIDLTKLREPATQDALDADRAFRKAFAEAQD